MRSAVRGEVLRLDAAQVAAVRAAIDRGGAFEQVLRRQATHQHFGVNAGERFGDVLAAQALDRVSEELGVPAFDPMRTSMERAVASILGAPHR